MGKYMRRKPKTAEEVAVPPLTNHLSHSPLGVCTRAKTLALRRLLHSSTAAVAASGGSFLQLRSRRLEKPQISGDSKRRQSQMGKQRGVPNPNPNLIPNEPDSRAEEKIEGNKNGSDDLAVEASFGDNVLEFEGRARSTRETTPCSLIKNPDTIRTPSSTTKRSTSSITADRRVVQNSTERRHIPTAQEINVFFAAAEEQHQRQFMEKYNFDPVKGTPLVGRYEWVKLNP